MPKRKFVPNSKCFLVHKVTTLVHLTQRGCISIDVLQKSHIYLLFQARYEPHVNDDSGSKPKVKEWL